jgi:O-antigen ligase
MLLVGISALPLLVMLFCRYPMFLLCAFPTMELVDVFFGSVFNVGGFDLIPMDSMYFFAIAYLGVCILRYPKKVAGLLRENIFLTVFLALAGLYVVIYTPIHGQSAIGEARKLYAFFLVPLLALIVIKRPEDLHRFVQAIILAAALAAIVTVRLALIQGSIIKVVDSEASLIVALAAFAMLIHRFHGLVVFHPKMDRVLLFLFAVLAIGCGHRSVWLAIGFGLMLVLWLHISRPSFVVKCVAVALWLLMAAASALVYFPKVAANLGEKFEGIMDPYSDSTASWRIEGWQYQLGQLQDSGRLLFGEGLGGYYSWQFQGGEKINYSPHNAYVQMTLKFGLFGLAIYVLLVFQLFRKVLIYRKRLPSGPIRTYLDIGLLSFGAGHGYMLGYNIVPVIWFFFAVAVSAIKLSDNFHRVTPWSPAHARRSGRFRWLPSMPAPHAPVTRYER